MIANLPYGGKILEWARIQPPFSVNPKPAPSPARQKETPMMRQFHAAKRQHPGALVFFRMGDFYEMFFEDAKLAADELGLALTSRNKEKDVPMAGVPVKAMEGYLVRLVRAGHTVAICEQVQDPREATGIVDRDVVRVVSPGTLVEEEALDSHRPLWVLAVHLGGEAGDGDSRPVGLAWADLSTGALRCASSEFHRFSEDLARIGPAEVLLPEQVEEDDEWSKIAEIARASAASCATRQAWDFEAGGGRRALCSQLGVKTLEAFGLEDERGILAACGGLLGFLEETQKGALDQFRDLEVRRSSGHMVLDEATRNTLEIAQSSLDGSREGSLLGTVDRTSTPMGARALREWLLEPLLCADSMRARHQSVAELIADLGLRKRMGDALEGMGDLERAAARLASGRAGGRDLVSIARALERIPGLRDEAGSAQDPLLDEIAGRLDPCPEITARILSTLVDDPPLALKEGGLVRTGFHEEVDELRSLAEGGRDHLAALQAREIERTGIPNLKVGFNKVFGYYLEVTHAHTDKVPEEYHRKQTLKNAERYITTELKEYEAKVMGAEEKSRDLEYEIFLALRRAAGEEAGRMQATARAVAELDALRGFAVVAQERNYARPEILDPEGEEFQVLDIREGRHPVVEACMQDPFIPNGVSLDSSHTLSVLTGPNMSGKSTWLRQAAHVVILAQAGSFVPAASARIGPVDRVFTRLGSADDISRGASTFMVEMVETARILRHATDQSLILLDEVGRGTSTFDGMAIAWAVCEHVHDTLRSRCLFATHYHQLTDLADSLGRARNLNVAVREWGDEIVFLHQIEEGGTDRSYGIHVARLAGLPAGVLERSRGVLERLEREEEGLTRRILPGEGDDEPILQHSLFDLLGDADAVLLKELEAIDLDSLPPIEAWKLVGRLRQALNRKGLE